MVEASLDALGWMDTDRYHKPVKVTGTQIDNSIEIQPNVIGISTETSLNQEWEMGSGLEHNVWTFFLDIYAENEDVGIHLAGDLYDIIRGKMPSIGRSLPEIPIYDLTQATPTELFICEFDNVDIGRSRDWMKPFNKFWWTVGFDVSNYYDNEDDV
jgi:hypothetical protein